MGCVRALIDGHNAIHALRLKASKHEELRRELARRVLAVDPDATIYFDAKHAGPLPFDSAREGGVRVVYCRHRDADDEILDAVRDAERPRELLVVTNDREVKGRAAQLGARVSGVADFFERPAPKKRGEGGGGGYSPADFGLPDEIDTDDPGWR